MTTAASNDPFLDEDTKVDFSSHAEDRELAALATEPIDTPTYDAKDFEPEEVPGESLQEYLKRAASGDPTAVLAKKEPAAESVPVQADDAVPAQVVDVPTPSKAEVHQYADGSSLSVEKTSKGWKAVCDTGIAGVAPEVFYGATKDEMWQNVAAGKINATKKIREQNRRIKLEAEVAAPAAAEPAAPPTTRDLSADEIFEIRTALESNPDLALTTWFQKKFGMAPDQMAKLVNKGAVASDELDAEAESRDFISAHPDYYSCGENLFNVSAYLAKKFLKTTQTQENSGVLYDRLVSGGYWTNKNLSNAYDELNESGLLEFAPVAAEPEPVPQPAPRAAAPAPAAADTTPDTDSERIVRTVRRPRAGLGLRTSETTNVPARASDKPPSAEDLDNLSDAEIQNLYNAVRRERLTSRR